MYAGVVHQPISSLKKRDNFSVIKDQFKEISSSCVLGSVVVQAEALSEISACKFMFSVSEAWPLCSLDSSLLKTVCVLVVIHGEREPWNGNRECGGDQR